jgi:DNA repair exonuclease SbcCD ATPase subunit
MATKSDLEILETVPVNAGKYGRCRSCSKKDNNRGRDLYNIILYDKISGEVTAELRCRDCEQIQENPLISIVRHSYIARSAAETSCHQLSSNIYVQQQTINNLNTMCAINQQRAEKAIYDYTQLLNAYNAGQQINTDVIAKLKTMSEQNKYLEENYQKSQLGINDMKTELATLQASSLKGIERLKSEHSISSQKYIEQIAEQTTKINEQTKQIAEQTVKIADQAKKYSNLEGINNRLRLQVSELEKINDQTSKINDQTKQIAEQNKKYSNLEDINNRLKLQISELEKSNNDLKTQIETLANAAKQNKSLEQSNKDLKTQIAVLKKTKLVQNSELVESLEQSNRDLKNQIDELTKTNNEQTNLTIEQCKIGRTYEDEIIVLRGKLTEMVNENKRIKSSQKARCFEIIKNNEIILKATRQQADDFQKKIEEKYFHKELEIAEKYEEMLKEFGIDVTYKHAVQTKYKSKLLLLTYFKQNMDFGKIQPYTSDTIKVNTTPS